MDTLKKSVDKTLIFKTKPWFVLIGGTSLAAYFYYFNRNKNHYEPSDKDPCLEASSPTYIYLDEKIKTQRSVRGLPTSIHPDTSVEEENAILEAALWNTVFTAKSKTDSQRRTAQKQLVQLPFIHDYLLSEVSQALDCNTAIELSRMSGCNPKFFPPFPPLPPKHPSPDEESITAMLIEMLASLPREGISKCLQDLITVCVISNLMNPLEQELGGRVGKGDDIFHEDYSYRPQLTTPQPVRLLDLLESLYGYTLTPGLGSALRRHHILLVLHRIYLQKQDSMPYVILIAKILATLALDQSYHCDMFHLGWMRVLVEWLHSDLLQLRLLARKTLLNLRSHRDKAVYDTGIYLLSDFPGVNNGLKADVVFVHGLIGSVFRTWRQNNILGRGQKASCPHCRYVANCRHMDPNFSDCWPQDWLAQQFPEVRLLAIDYASHWSERPSRCQIEQDRRSIEDRSLALLEKLQLTELGSRPIVWICHSMGGLITKQMLSLAATSSNPKLREIYDQTRGILFMSVPHHGSKAADISHKWRHFVNPSIEVLELTSGNPRLAELHNHFLDYARDMNVLSLVEGAKMDIGFNVKMILVSPEDADPGLGNLFKTDESHLSICKPQSPESLIYQLVVNFLETTLDLQPLPPPKFCTIPDTPPPNKTDPLSSPTSS